MATGLKVESPLKLLMLCHYFEERGGGIELVAAALARELAVQGMEVTWLATGNSGQEGERGGCRRGALSASALCERLLRIPYPVLLPTAWRRIFRETARHEVVLVHDALYMTSIVASLAARVHRKPLVVVQHVGFVPYRSALLRALMRTANRCIAGPLLRRSDRVVFVSGLTQDYFAQVRCRHAPALIFNGLDVAHFSPVCDQAQIAAARRELGLPGAGPVVLFVGRFVEKKGLLILEYMARARSEITFAFAGRGPLDPVSWGLPNVRVFSELAGAHLATLYRCSDLLLLPSAGEGFPLVIQEAMGCGLPVLCGKDTVTADPGAAPFIQGVEVDLAEPERTAQLFSEAMTRVLASPHTPAERGRSSEYAHANYSWAASSARYAGILRGLRDAGHGAAEIRTP